MYSQKWALLRALVTQYLSKHRTNFFCILPKIFDTDLF